jgi:outer membrane protein
VKITPFWPSLVLFATITIVPAARAAGAPAGWSVNVGGGALFAPAFPGSSDYQLRALPSVRVSYGDRFAASYEQGVSYIVAQSDRWSLAPLLKVDFGRDADGKGSFVVAGSRSEALRGFADIDTTLQAGARVGFADGAWSGSAALLQGLNGHEGLTLELALDRSTRLASGWVLGTGPRLEWGDRKYNHAFFGVTPAAALGSGLAGYSAGAGINSAGWNLSALCRHDNGWTWIASLGYARLLGDAGDSPLVRVKGDRDQARLGLFVAKRL